MLIKDVFGIGGFAYASLGKGVGSGIITSAPLPMASRNSL